MADEYSGSGHFVGESTVEPSAPAPAKKTSIQERKSKTVEVKNPDAATVGQTAMDTLNSMGEVNPPIGEVISGIGNQVLNGIKEHPIASTLVGAGGLYAAWKALNNKPPDDNNPPNNPPNNKWDRTVAGRPANATLGAPVPTLTEPVAPTAAAPATPAAPVAPTTTTPPATFPAQATQQPLLSGYKPATGNLIEGAPNPIMGAAPAPAAVAPAPVPPVDPLVQAKLDALADKQRRDNEAHAAQQRRLDEAHQIKLANEAKRSELLLQNNQGKAASPTSADEQATKLIIKSAENKVSKAVAQSSKPTVPAPVEPTPEPSKMKWPGGAEGSALQLFGGTKKNFTPESQASLEMFKDYVGGQLTMPPSGGSIHQIDQASKFYEKYTGKPLPRSPEGKLVPIPEAQIKELHAGINTELSDAVKGNKLGPMGKGAMAAAALLGLTTAVQAAQKGDFGPLREAGFDIGGPVAAGKLGLGLLSKAGGAGFSALTYTGGLNENEGRDLAQRRYKFEQESQKLGSPFRSVPPPR